MRFWVYSVVAWAVISLGGMTHAVENISGSTWGTVVYDAGEDEKFTIGNINQGIDWLDYHGLRLRTFAQFRYRFLTPEGETFNTFGPSLGVSLKKWGLELGAEYFWQYRDSTEAIEDGPRYFLEWYYGWDLKRIFR